MFERTPLGHAAGLQQAARPEASPQTGSQDGHPGARRPAPVHINQTVEHKLTECPKCLNPVGEPCGKHTRIVEDIPPVKPTVTEHVV